MSKKIYSKNLLVAICISALFISCSSDNKTWKIAKSNNDVISYEYYLENNPNGKYSDSARFFIDEIILTQTKKPTSLPLPLTPPIAFWNNMIIDSICFQIKINADPRSREFEIETETNYFNYFKEVLAKCGITIVSKNTICKTNMIITLNVIALGANYTNIGYRYSGYEVKGKISLSTDGQIPITLSINEKKPIPETIIQSSIQQQFNKMTNTKRESPGYAMPNLKTEDFADFIYKIWGTSPLIWLQQLSKYNFDSPEDNGRLSKYDINNIIRACYGNDYNSRIKALNIIKSGNLQLEPKEAILLVTYNIRNYGLMYEKNINDVCLNALNNMGASAMDVVPVLIKYIEDRRKKGWLDNSEILRKLEMITGMKLTYDPATWKKWWFYNNNKLLKD